MSTQVGFRWWHAALVVAFLILVGKLAMYKKEKDGVPPKYEEAAAPAPPVYEEPRAVAAAEAPPAPAPDPTIVCTTDLPCAFFGFRKDNRETVEKELELRMSLPGCAQATINIVKPVTELELVEHPKAADRFYRDNGKRPSFSVEQGGITDVDTFNLCAESLRQLGQKVNDDE